MISKIYQHVINSLGKMLYVWWVKFDAGGNDILLKVD